MLTAIQQVEDALSGIRILSREVKVQAEDVRISRQATQITLNEYKAGTQAFTAVVTAETQQLGAEESLLSTQGQLQADAVNLIVALGGGWSQSMLPDVTAETSAHSASLSEAAGRAAFTEQGGVFSPKQW